MSVGNTGSVGIVEKSSQQNPLAHNEWVDRLSTYSLLRGEERKSRLKQKGQRIFDFGLGDPVEPTPKFIVEKLKAALPEVSQYPSAIGCAEYRKSCANWLKRRMGIDVSWEDQIVSSNGSKEAIYHIPLILLNAASARRIIVLPDPGFPVYRSSTILAGGICYEVALRPEVDYVFEPECIPSEILPSVAACWVSYPHNPTGAVLTKEQAEKIYLWALENNIVLLSDECYVDMYFPNTPPPVSFLEISSAHGFKNVLAFFSLSKRSGMTGYRSGFVAGDCELMKRFSKLRPHIGLGTPTFVQLAGAAAWDEDTHARDRNQLFHEKRALVESFLVKHGFAFVPTNATFYVWVRCPQHYSCGEDYVEALCENTGIVATGADALGKSSKEYFRLALVPSAKEIAQALEVWEKWILGKHC